MTALSIPFSTANTCSLCVTSRVSPDVVRKLALLNVSVCGVGMSGIRGVKVALKMTPEVGDAVKCRRHCACTH